MKIVFVINLMFFSFLALANNPDLPDPSTITKKYLEELSKREVGQSQFVIQESEQYEEQSEEEQGDRDIQESDVYKIGRKGSKELFLLNNYRGFQVVSFTDGLEKPKLIGRLPIFNNWSSEMYYLEAKDRVLVINTEWTDSESYWTSNYQTKLYLLDVSNSSEPKILKEETVPGYLSTSRLVGDVLYTVTSNGDWDKTKAIITSLKIEGDSVTEIDKAELHGPSRYVREMNVVKHGSKFYVISTLSKWNSDGDYVNVHNITSTKGKILKVMTAKAMGSVGERSQVFLHKEHLFSVSNYASEGKPARIAVEAYPLVKATEVVTSKDHMRVTIGDTTGLNTSLQDVRTSGDLLYTFWVPANNVDPFDLLDISNPSAGIKHLGQLQFEGWVAKAFPIEYNGKKFVLGLGWVIPTTSEEGQRYPQAKLFEIKKDGETYKHQEVGSITVNSDDVWGNFNDEDKNFSMIEASPGVYNILFPVTFMRTWNDGAKVITANLNTLAMAEGASIVGDQDWLRRVFLNDEVRAVHAFGDKSLASYNQDDMATRGIARTVSILELARNIIDFQVLNTEEGYQVVQNDESVEIRKVSLSHSDAEKTEVLGITTLKGIYGWHKQKEGKLHVITYFKKPRAEDQDDWDREFDYAQMNTVTLGSMEVQVERLDIEFNPEDEGDYFYFSVESTPYGKDELLTISENFYRISGNGLSRINIAEDCKYFFDSNTYNLSLVAMAEELYAYNAFGVKPIDVPEEDEEGSYSMPFFKKLSINENELSCGASVNTPGKPVLKKNDFVVVSEQNYYDCDHCEYEEEKTKKGINYSYAGWDDDFSKTFSLKYKNEKEIEIVEILNKDITSTLYKDGFITYAPKEARLDVWSINAEGEFISKPQYLNYENTSSRLIAVKAFNSKNYFFMKDDKKVDVYEIGSTNRVSRLAVTSTYDTDLEDGSAEFIFDISSIVMGTDPSRFHVAQGNFGVSDIILK
ncbi:MAG TPA: beta-propeller domain-containing protein [Bacteriovoracaceae bacterium]|nr:beta-propeller domain-containing protein [Bacteriovoracaceae bacterium]